MQRRLKMVLGSAYVIPLEAKHHKIVSGGDVCYHGSTVMCSGAILNWDTSIISVSDEEVRSRPTATSATSEQKNATRTLVTHKTNEWLQVCVFHRAEREDCSTVLLSILILQVTHIIFIDQIEGIGFPSCNVSINVVGITHIDINLVCFYFCHVFGVLQQCSFPIWNQ